LRLGSRPIWPTARKCQRLLADCQLRRPNRTEWTDDDGRFQFSGLFPGVFVISARVVTHYLDSADDQPVYVRTGGLIKLRMVKGGIITGEGSNLSGGALIVASVKPPRIRGQEGKEASRGAGQRGILSVYNPRRLST